MLVLPSCWPFSGLILNLLWDPAFGVQECQPTRLYAVDFLTGSLERMRPLFWQGLVPERGRRQGLR